MSHERPRVILRADKALILVPEPRWVAGEDGRDGDWGTDDTKNVELHLSTDDYVALTRQMPGLVHDFVAWVLTLDDPDPESQGFQDRRTATMTEIIRRAREAMGVQEE